MTKDWRLERLEDEDALRGVSFVRKVYRAYRPGWEHDHCIACWQTLAEPSLGVEDAIHEGYATTDEYFRGADYEWVCPDRFRAFAGEMGWRDLTTQRSM